VAPLWGGRPRPRPAPWAAFSPVARIWSNERKAGRGRPARTRGSALRRMQAVSLGRAIARGCVLGARRTQRSRRGANQGTDSEFPANCGRKSESVAMGDAPTESDENRPSAAPRFFNELRATFGSGPGLRAIARRGLAWQPSCRGLRRALAGFGM
jgi:hypothetical protein